MIEKIKKEIAKKNQTKPENILFEDETKAEFIFKNMKNNTIHKIKKHLQEADETFLDA